MRGPRIANGTWLLMVTILVLAYKSNLVTYMTTPRKEPLPSSFEQLAARPDTQLILLANTKFLNMFMVGTEEVAVVRLG